MICYTMRILFFIMAITFISYGETDSISVLDGSISSNVWESVFPKGEMPEGIPISGLSFPVAYYDDGSIQARFNAKEAFLPADESAFVLAKDLMIEHYDEAGAVNGYYIASECKFDRIIKTGYCDCPIRIEHRAPDRNISIVGTNMQWNLESRIVKISSGVRVKMSKIMDELGGAFR